VAFANMTIAYDTVLCALSGRRAQLPAGSENRLLHSGRVSIRDCFLNKFLQNSKLASAAFLKRHPASAHIPCGSQASVLEEAHGICALALSVLRLLTMRSCSARYTKPFSRSREKGWDEGISNLHNV
jgi:hypothetical protein